LCGLDKSFAGNALIDDKENFHSPLKSPPWKGGPSLHAATNNICRQAGSHGI